MSRLFRRSDEERRAFFELAVPKTCRGYAGGKNSLEGYCIADNGIFEREKQPDDI